MADLSVDSGEVPLDMRLKSLISWKRVFIATIGVVAAVAIIGVALGAVGTGFGISAWNDVDSVEDDVDKLEDVVNRVKVPSPEDRFSNIPHGASAPLGAYDDDHDYAAGHLKATGHTSILPYYDGNSQPQGGSLSVMVEQRSYEGSFSYGHGTANCTNTERLLRVWGNSGPIVEGQNVGSNDGKATAGWKSYEQTLIADNTDYPESANFFAFGNHSAVFTYLSAAENLVQGIVSGTADDFDAMTVSTGPAGVAVYTNPSDCMFAGKQHQDQQHHLVARTAAPGVGAGGEVELCLVNSNAPYTVSCSAPAAFNAGEDIIIVDVNYIAGSETFLVTFVSGATGLQSIVVTVDRILLTTTLSAATIVDAAFVDQDCYKSDIVQSGTVFTYLYGGDGAIGLTAARYTLSGTTLTLVVAPAVLDASTTLVFDAASISASHFVVAVHDLATNILGELRLFSAVGTVSPSLEARLSYINNEGPVVTFRPVTLSSFGSDAILVGYSGVEWEYRPVAQIWHLHDAGTGYTLIPGEDKPMGRTVVDTTSCVPLATGERAICNFAPYASSLAGYSIKVSKLRSQQEASPLYARGLTNVFRSGHAPVGVALNDADAGDYVLVRQGGCMQTPSGVNQYANERKLCLHGDGTVTPNIHVSDANSMLWEPVCGLCRSTGASTYTCGYIVA